MIWYHFGIDVCEWDGDDACIVASTIYTCKAPRAGTAERLDKLFCLDPGA
jgi:hypothetical protein